MTFFFYTRNLPPAFPCMLIHGLMKAFVYKILTCMCSRLSVIYIKILKVVGALLFFWTDFGIVRTRGCGDLRPFMETSEYTPYCDFFMSHFTSEVCGKSELGRGFSLR